MKGLMWNWLDRTLTTIISSFTGLKNSKNSKTKSSKKKKKTNELGLEDSDDFQNGEQKSKKKKGGKRKTGKKSKKDGAKKELAREESENQLQRQSSDVYPSSPKPSVTRSSLLSLSALPPLPGMKKNSLPSLPTKEMDWTLSFIIRRTASYLGLFNL